jgi:hypothetical protein
MNRLRLSILLSGALLMLVQPGSAAPAGAASGLSDPPRDARHGPAPRDTDRSVIAIIENNGLNVLHEDFKLAPGQKLVLPPAIPRPTWVSLPRSGTFEEQVDRARSGVLGHMKPGELYWIRGTRIGIFSAPDSQRTDLFVERFHGTGTVSSAVGRNHGTNPDGLALFIPSTSEQAWTWLADQEWIDIVSTSYVTAARGGAGGVSTCPEASHIRTLAERGQMVFSAAGNYEQLGAGLTPSGSPYSYQVGGVDSQGKTYLPAMSGTSYSLTPTRAYETGDRFEFMAADPDSLQGSSLFGGTSGAAPSTAGRAATLVEFARDLVGAIEGTRVRDGALVEARRGARTPSEGPLQDGELTREELTDLLHHVAVPAEPASPARYLVEGYGALNGQAIQLARRVLRGTAEEPSRPDEDVMYGIVEEIRMALFPSARCG